jgi:hypothetical protein
MSVEHIFSKATSRKGSKTELSVKGMANMADQSIGFDGPNPLALHSVQSKRRNPDAKFKFLATLKNDINKN